MVRGITIRKLEVEDLGRLNDTAQEVLSHNPGHRSWDQALLAEIMADDTGLLFAAARKKQITGFIIGACDKLDGEIESLSILWSGVIPPLARRGIEEELFNKLREEAISRGIKKINCHVRDRDQDRIAFYRGTGFAETGAVIEMELDL